MRWLSKILAVTGVLLATPVAADPNEILLLNGIVQPVLDLDFRTLTALPASITYTRAGATYDWGCNPVGQLQAFSDNVPMFPICDPVSGFRKGWGTWGLSGFFQNTWSRDLTNAAWVKTNTTAALDQTGADGSANAASSLLATAANATTIHSTNNGSAQNRVGWAFVKRLVGTGPIYISSDRGANWTPITNAINTTRYTLVTPQGVYAAQAATMQGIAFKIDTSGDKIAVDFAMYENDNNLTYVPPSPAIVMLGSTNQQRAADVNSMLLSAISGFNPDSFTVVAQAVLNPQWRGNGSGNRRTILQFDDGTTNNLININFQADSLANPNCTYGTGNKIFCPDTNADTKAGGVGAGKVRCSAGGNGGQLSGLVQPYQSTVFTVAFGYAKASGMSIICDNGYGDTTITEVTDPGPALASQALTQLHFGGPSNFASYLGAYLTRVTIYPKRLQGSDLIAVMQKAKNSAPQFARQYIKLNGGRLLYNTNGQDTCYLC